MVIERRLLWQIAAACAAVLLLWGGWELTPGRGLERAQDRLLRETSARNWPAVTALLDEAYRDDWGQDRATAVASASEALQNFLTLHVTAADPQVTRDGRNAQISTTLRVQGRGNAIGEAIRDAVNGLRSPFQFAWRQKSWKPWDWKLVGFSQPEIEPTGMP
jgi:hypothetical protein